MKTLADLKRTIKPGVRLLVVQHDYRPELTGTERIVTDIQGNGYFFRTAGDDRRSWSPYVFAKYSFPEPDTYRQDQGLLCSCCVSEPSLISDHSETCNLRTGKRMAWTIKVMPNVKL